jgi:outer membrane protein assembly factor BamB
MVSFRRLILPAMLLVALAAPAILVRAQEATPEPGSRAPIIWRTGPGANYGDHDLPVAFAGDKVYIVEPDGTLRARLVADGTSLWSEPTGLTSGVIQVSATDGFVAVVRGGEMKVYDSEIGTELWTRPTTDPNDVFPMASFSGNLLITSELDISTAPPHSTGTIYGLNVLDGTQESQRTAGGGLDSYPIPVADGVAFVSLSNGSIEAIDVSNGAVVWQGEASTTGYTAPIISGEVVLAQGENASDQPTITAFDKDDGTVLWTADPSGYLEGIAGASVITTSAADFDSAGSAVASVRALDIETGVERWTIENASVSSVASQGDTGFLAIFSMSPTGELTASVNKLDAQSGAIEETLPIENPSFSLTPCGDKLLVRHGAFVASVNQSDLAVAYDYAVGWAAPQVLCNGDVLAATVASDGSLAVHDTTVVPDLAPGVPLTSAIPAPFFVSRPITVPQTPELMLGVWRGQISADGWVELPEEFAGLNLFVEEGAALILESREAAGPGAPVIRAEAGEVLEVPDTGTAVRSDGGSVATLYVAGLLPEDHAGRIGGEILPGFEPVGMVAVGDRPGEVLQITVTAISVEAGTGTWPRLSSWPSMVLVTSDSLEVPTAPGVQQPTEQRSIALLDLLADAGATEAVGRDQVFSVVSPDGSGDGLLVMVEPTVETGVLAFGCAGRCWVP